jgi:hypothetical protein
MSFPPHGQKGSVWLGYALLIDGVREHDRPRIDAGLLAIDCVVDQRDGGAELRSGDGAFDHMMLASAYNVAVAEASSNPLFVRYRPAWEQWLRRMPLVWLPNEHHYANKYLVEAVAVLELERTGLTSNVRGSILSERRSAVARATKLVNHIVPAYGRRTSKRLHGRPGFVLSDPSNNALAYHGLSLGFYARAISLLGHRASPAAHEALARVVHASWTLMGPDGDAAYIGRSQEMAWALALTAYGSESAAQAERNPQRAARFRAVADRGLRRLRSAYGSGPYGFYVTPALRVGPRSALAGLDTYANGPSYSGLTLMALDWAAKVSARDNGPVARIGSDAPGGGVLSSGRLRFATLRTGDSWFAVKRSSSATARDLRYDFGLVALESRRRDGTWRDVMPVRPHTTGAADGAGPVLRSNGRWGLPDGRRIRRSPNGIAVTGGYRTSHGQPIKGGMRLSVARHACGVAVRFRVAAGDQVEYSVFLRENGRIRRSRRSATDGVQAITFPADAAVHTRGSYSSGSDPRLKRLVLTFGARRTRTVEIGFCAA